MIDSREKVGCLEFVSFPDLKLDNVLAKIDTGAYSGALHCTAIKVVRKGLKRTPVLRFTPLGNPNFTTETESFEKVFVRSATGHKVKRYIITTHIKINNKVYETSIGLSDRSDMRREALIGRKFLRDNNLIVDVRKNSELDDERQGA